jgi:hypothetical protein
LIGQKNLEVVAHFFRECTIRRCAPADKDPDRPVSEQEWCLYTKHKPERVLGRHPSKEDAMEQEKAIHAHGALIERVAQDPTPAGPTPGRGKGMGGPPQGAGGMEVCVCPIDGKEYPKEKGVPCTTKECPEHPGTRLIGKPKAEQIPPAAPKGLQQRIGPPTGA